jgi:hypothetical protein
MQFNDIGTHYSGFVPVQPLVRRDHHALYPGVGTGPATGNAAKSRCGVSDPTRRHADRRRSSRACANPGAPSCPILHRTELTPCIF